MVAHSQPPVRSSVSAIPVATLTLTEHVGHQVSVTGTLDDRTHVKVRSVKRVAASCS